jgi:CheY-like chemotaxis protein
MPKILVLDDNRDVLETVTFILGKRRKMNVVTLNDPSLLHLFLREHKPDVLLMDVCLGDYDGMDLCRQGTISKRPPSCFLPPKAVPTPLLPLRWQTPS